MAQATQPTVIMSDNEALGYLIDRGRRGPVNTSARELVRAFGWPDDDAHRIKVGRRLRSWEGRGLIKREPAPDGRQVVTIGTVNNTVNNTVNIALVQQQAERPVAGISSVNRRVFTLPFIGLHQIGAGALAALGLYVAWTGLQINANFGHSLGRTPESAHLFEALAWSGEAAALMLPTAALALWHGGHRGRAMAAWAMEMLVVGMAWLAAIGFASVNISDTTANRGRIASESTTLAAQIERLTHERAAIGETRAVPAIEAEIQAAQSQPPVVAVWSRTNGCRDVTQAKSGEACGPLLRLRQALGEAQRRDALDNEMRQKQAALAGLPAVTAADPQAEEAAKVVTWASRGLLAITASDVSMVRVTGLTMLQLIPGLLLMLAASLWGLKAKGESKP